MGFMISTPLSNNQEMSFFEWTGFPGLSAEVDVKIIDFTFQNSPSELFRLCKVDHAFHNYINEKYNDDYFRKIFFKKHPFLKGCKFECLTLYKYHPDIFWKVFYCNFSSLTTTGEIRLPICLYIEKMGLIFSNSSILTKGGLRGNFLELETQKHKVTNSWKVKQEDIKNLVAELHLREAFVNLASELGCQEALEEKLPQLESNANQQYITYLRGELKKAENESQKLLLEIQYLDENLNFLKDEESIFLEHLSEVRILDSDMKFLQNFLQAKILPEEAKYLQFGDWKCPLSFTQCYQYYLEPLENECVNFFNVEVYKRFILEHQECVALIDKIVTGEVEDAPKACARIVAIINGFNSAQWIWDQLHKRRPPVNVIYGTVTVTVESFYSFWDEEKFRFFRHNFHEYLPILKELVLESERVLKKKGNNEAGLYIQF